VSSQKPSTMIMPHLPHLRRYARALCGTQELGDLYVTTVLEALVADPSLLEQAHTGNAEPKIKLFRLFHALWKVTEQTENVFRSIELPQEISAQSHLQRLTPRTRQALLLVAMEGFTAYETADILDTDLNEIASLIEIAHKELDAQSRTDVLIIEDEPIIALDISRIVKEQGHNVITTAATRDEAVAAAKEHRPGLVLADIQLADGSSGIDAVNDILGDIDVPVIFITAFPERLLTGERPEPAFLITKPFMPDAVKVAMSQALFFNRPHTADALAS
jgi:CheY-like chemotaxis protein/DNA-directed RNA polymerase specialized sigma24 family protein